MEKNRWSKTNEINVAIKLSTSVGQALPHIILTHPQKAYFCSKLVYHTFSIHAFSVYFSYFFMFYILFIMWNTELESLLTIKMRSTYFRPRNSTSGDGM